MNAQLRTLTLATMMLWCVSGVYAETIVKLNLGTDSMPDIRLVDGVLSTAPDAVGATAGDQNTEVSYLGALSGQAPIEGENGSLTLAGVQLLGQPSVFFETTVLQETSGGTFELYNPNNELLLSGTLGHGTLSGPIGGTATGGFLTTEFGDFTGGLLLPVLQESQLFRSLVSVSLLTVNQGQGMSLGDDDLLEDFVADASANIGASIPEPAGGLLLALGALAMLVNRRRGHSAHGTLRPDTSWHS